MASETPLPPLGSVLIVGVGASLGTGAANADAARVTRLPSGHPEAVISAAGYR